MTPRRPKRAGRRKDRAGRAPPSYAPQATPLRPAPALADDLRFESVEQDAEPDDDRTEPSPEELTPEERRERNPRVKKAPADAVPPEGRTEITFVPKFIRPRKRP